MLLLSGLSIVDSIELLGQVEGVSVGDSIRLLQLGTAVGRDSMTCHGGLGGMGGENTMVTLAT